jgi:hypothetical protein
MLNYRSRQLLGMIHDSRYANYALQFDPRVTYLNSTDPIFYLPSTYSPQIGMQTSRPSSTLYVLGQEDPPDSDGIMRAQWTVTVTQELGPQFAIEPSPVAAITQLGSAAPGIMGRQYGSFAGRVGVSMATVAVTKQPNSKLWLNTYNFISNLSQPIALGDSGYTFQFYGLIGDTWNVTTTATPKRSICDMVNILQSMSQSTLAAVFTTQSEEPWNTYRNLWELAPETSNRMIGFLLAYLHQLELLRVNSGS